MTSRWYGKVRCHNSDIGGLFFSPLKSDKMFSVAGDETAVLVTSLSQSVVQIRPPATMINAVGGRECPPRGSPDDVFFMWAGSTSYSKRIQGLYHCDKLVSWNNNYWRGPGNEPWHQEWMDHPPPAPANAMRIISVPDSDNRLNWTDMVTGEHLASVRRRSDGDREAGSGNLGGFGKFSACGKYFALATQSGVNHEKRLRSISFLEIYDVASFFDDRQREPGKRYIQEDFAAKYRTIDYDFPEETHKSDDPTTVKQDARCTDLAIAGGNAFVVVASRSWVSAHSVVKQERFYANGKVFDEFNPNRDKQSKGLLCHDVNAPQYEGRVYVAVVSPSAVSPVRTFAVGCGRTIKILAQDGSVRSEFLEKLGSGITSMLYSREGKHLIVATLHGLQVLQASAETITGSIFQRNGIHTAWMCSIGLSVDGCTLATTASDDALKLWSFAVKENGKKGEHSVVLRLKAQLGPALPVISAVECAGLNTITDNTGSVKRLLEQMRSKSN